MVIELKTRVFELVGKNKKYQSLATLAQAMGISISQLYRVKKGERQINREFIIGAMEAFSDHRFESLFYFLENGVPLLRQVSKPKRITKKKSAIEQTDIMLTVREVAQRLGAHINTVRRWSDRGLLKVYHIGTRGDRRYRQEDITAFLKESTVGR